MKLRKFKTKVSMTPKTYGVSFMWAFITVGKSEKLQLLMGFYVHTQKFLPRHQGFIQHQTQNGPGRLNKFKCQYSS